MKGVRIESIKLSDIDMNKCYFNPSCALSIYKPESEHKVLAMLNKYFGTVKKHNICCQHDPGLSAGSTIINNCAGCDKSFRSMYEGIQTISLWEILDSIENLPLPDYAETIVSVQDPCFFRPKPQVHAAVRSILRKTNIRIIECQYSGTSSICCGDNFYPTLSIEAVNKLQKKRAAQMPCQDVVVYCVSCIKSMAIGKKTAHYMVDLILGEKTETQETRLDLYYDAINEYIDTH